MIQIKNDFLELNVSPLGAEWQSIRAQLTGQEYLWQGNPEYWSRRAPLLFPIVGELVKDTYRLNGDNFILKRHGFARNQTFDLIEQSPNVVEFELCANSETLQNYPFHFSFRIRYELLNNSIVTTLQVFNPDSVVLPFSLGAHPAFQLPAGMENSSIEFESQENARRYFVRNGLIASESTLFETKDRELFLNPDLFNDDALVFHSLKSKSIIIKSNNSPLVKMDWDDSFSYFGIWSQRNCNQFICLEPWAGIADSHDFTGDFTTKAGLMLLPPLQCKKFQFTCTFY